MKTHRTRWMQQGPKVRTDLLRLCALTGWLMASNWSWADSYNVSIHPGLNLLCNQLDRGSNTADEVFSLVPDGCVLYKFDNASQSWTRAYYDASFGSWSPARITLNPGEGAFFFSPAN